MKKILKRTLQILLVTLVSGGCYYLYILYSKGNTSIHYLEPRQEYATFQELLQDPALKGKLVYVDVWRTTCHPCLEEFKAVPKLKQYFSRYGD